MNGVCPCEECEVCKEVIANCSCVDNSGCYDEDDETCPDCLEHFEACECDDSDFCPECDEPWEDCECDDDEV